MPRSLSSLAAAASAGRRLRRSGSNVRQMRTSAVAFRAGRPNRWSWAGAKPAKWWGRGGATSLSTRSVVACRSRHSIERASREVISWLTIARRSACVTVAVRIGRRPRRWRIGPASSSSSRKRSRNGAVVVVGAEDEAQLLDAGVGLGVQDERSVGELARSGALAACEQAGEDAVAEPPRGIRRAPAGQRERVGPAGPDRPLDGHASTLRSSTAGPARAGGRRALS